MAKKISELDSPTLPLSGSELIEASQDSTSIQVTVTQLADKVRSESGIVDRGDPATSDFDAQDLTIDGTFYDLDLSSIVPEGAYAVLVNVQTNNSIIGMTMKIRKKGNVNNSNVSFWRTEIPGSNQRRTEIVFCDTNRVVEYAVDSGAWSNLSIYIRGWFI